jgi:ribosomal protein S8
MSNFLISDFVNIINVSSRGHLKSVYVPYTKLIFQLLDILYKNGIIYNFKFNTINNKADANRDKRQKFIALLILGYVSNLAKLHNVDLKQVQNSSNINLIPFFEYINFKNIELFDFDKIKIEDVDTSKNEDVERFILSHIYYITQK